MRFPRLILAVAIIAGGLCGTTLAQDAKTEGDAKSRYWIFLVTGKSAAGVPKEEIADKQKAHIDNFKRLAELKKLFAAGPMADPAKTKRGIVLIEAESLDKIPALFEPDPYVTEGFMKIDANKITKMVGETKINLVEQGMDELRIAVWDRATDSAGKVDAEMKAVRQAHEDHWTKWRAAKKVSLRCSFSEDSPHFGIIIFPKSDDTEIKKLLDSDPMVSAKLLNYSLMPQYLMKGALSVE